MYGIESSIKNLPHITLNKLLQCQLWSQTQKCSHVDEIFNVWTFKSNVSDHTRCHMLLIIVLGCVIRQHLAFLMTSDLGHF